MSLISEFKQFAMKGNVVDLAVGVIIGAAFGKIVESVVSDLIMPVIGAVTGGLDFSNYYLPLSGAVKAGLAYQDAKKAGAVLGYGNFITVAVNFLILAFLFRTSRNDFSAPNYREESKSKLKGHFKDISHCFFV